MNTVEETVEVGVPARIAYDQWTQFTSFPRFMTAVRGVEQIRPAVTVWVIGYGPMRHTFETEIVEQQPDSHLAWRSLGRHSCHRGDVTFRATAQGRTAITVRIRVRPRGVVGMLGQVPRVTSRAVRRELGHFKDFIEGHGESAGAWRGTIRDGRVRPVEAEPPGSRVPTWPVG